MDSAAELVARVKASRLPPVPRRKRIREDAGLSLRAMAEALGVDTMTVWRWEHGETSPRLAHAIAYRELLDALDAAVQE